MLVGVEHIPLTPLAAGPIGAGVGSLEHQKSTGAQQFPAVLDHRQGLENVFEDIQGDNGIIGRALGLEGLNIVGADVCEVSPVVDNRNGITSHLAAQCMFETLCVI